MNKGQPQGNGYGHGGFQQKAQFNYFKGKFQAPGSAAPIPSPQDNELNIMMSQLLEGQKKYVAYINVKGDSMYNDFHGKFETLSSHVRMLENQVAQTASTSARQM